MNINLSWDELRKRKLMVASPLYGGMCTGQYMKSMINLAVFCAQNGIYLETHFLFNESLVQRARNFLADTFMESECTNMMFIDADIGFEAKDVIAMLALQSPDAKDDDYDVISGVYPKKNISWEKVKLAVDKGAADDEPQNLENFVGDFAFNPVLGGPTQISLDVPVEVGEAATGFMLIRKQTMLNFRKAYPEQDYTPDSPRSDDWDGSRDITAFFDCIIEPESRRYLSEDYMFSHYVRKAGMKVWMCPWIPLSHFGTYNFKGSLPALASINADPQALDHQQRKLNKKAKK